MKGGIESFRKFFIGLLIAFLLVGIGITITALLVEICLPKILKIYPDLEPGLEPVFKDKLPIAVGFFLFGIWSYINSSLKLLNLSIHEIKFWKIAGPIISIGAIIYILIKIIQIYFLIAHNSG